ncbi:hypothetical protein RYX36_032978, partial [Vicia faba]
LNLHNLSHSPTTLKTLIQNLQNSKPYKLKSILQCQIIAYKISQASSSLESEMKFYLDHVIIVNLDKALQDEQNEKEQVHAIIKFRQRLSKGFDLECQDLILRAKVSTLLETTLIDHFNSKRVGHIGRREVVEAMMEQNLVKILMDLRRREGFGFDGCVSRFTIQLEVGEGLRSEEKSYEIGDVEFGYGSFKIRCR